MTDRMDEYLARVPSEHRNRPKFRATLKNTLAPACRLMELLDSVPKAYDVDHAVGDQLDVVGEWVGVSRELSAKLTGVYFEWDSSSLDTGWGRGLWKGKYDPESGITSLDDDTYRTLIKLRILTNRWDGTIETAYADWQTVLGDSVLVIQDPQDMTIQVGIAGKMLSTPLRALFKQQITPFKPAAVRVSVYYLSTVDAPLFAWSKDTEAMAGWGKGAWADEALL